MKRINGFLDLNSFVRRKHIKVDGPLADRYWLKIKNKDYLFKSTDYPYTELLVYEIASFLGVNAVPYDLATLYHFHGVISKSYRKKNCHYVSGKQILNNYIHSSNNIDELKKMGFIDDCQNAYFINNLEVIWQAIEYRYAKLGMNVDISQIMYDLVNQFILGILTQKNDSGPHNWELEEGHNGVSIVPVFDNEYCFTESYSGFNISTNFNDTTKNNWEILEEFLKISSSEFIELFLEKYYSLTLDVFLELIKRVEDKIGIAIPNDIKDHYINVFVDNRNNIEEVLNNLNIGQGRK